MNTDKTPHPVDIHVGQRVRIRRRWLEMSQTDLAKHLKVTFQQVQKLEKGQSRLVASRLWDLAELLDVPVSYFFDDFDDTRPTTVAPGRGVDPGLMRLFASLEQMNDREVRRALKVLVSRLVPAN